MYISEWEAPGGGLPLSNIRVTTKVAVNALLGDTPTLVNYGSALMANLGDKEVKAVVCILQFLVSNFLLTIIPFFHKNMWDFLFQLMIGIEPTSDLFIKS